MDAEIIALQALAAYLSVHVLGSAAALAVTAFVGATLRVQHTEIAAVTILAPVQVALPILVVLAVHKLPIALE